MKREIINCPYCARETPVHKHGNHRQPRCIHCKRFLLGQANKNYKPMFCRFCGNKVPKNPTGSCRQCNRLLKMVRVNKDIIPAMLKEV